MPDKEFTCRKCEETFDTQGKLNTHVLLNHPDLARANSDAYAASEHNTGHIESRAEKGEQFGYDG